MTKLWSEQNKLQHWLTIEKKHLPADLQDKMLVEIDDKFIKRFHAEDWKVAHDFEAFLRTLEEALPKEVRPFLHVGLTSSDVIDSAYSRLAQESLGVIRTSLASLGDTVAGIAAQHADSFCVARTHGMPAVVTSLKARLERYQYMLDRSYADITNLNIGQYQKMSGSAGGHLHCPRAHDEYSKFGATQIVPRDIYARMYAALVVLSSALEHIATDLRLMQRDGEFQEAFTTTQCGSSSMPHKRNPVLCENVCGLARMIRGLADPLVSAVTTWQERDISHSSIERVAVPQIFNYLDFIIQRLDRVFTSSAFDVQAMSENVQRYAPSLASHSMFNQLMSEGQYTREEAFHATNERIEHAKNTAGVDETIEQILLDNQRAVRHAVTFDLQAIQEPIAQARKELQEQFRQAKGDVSTASVTYADAALFVLTTKYSYSAVDASEIVAATYPLPPHRLRHRLAELLEIIGELQGEAKNEN
jgi:adenylosuccinate lyase